MKKGGFFEKLKSLKLAFLFRNEFLLFDSSFKALEEEDYQQEFHRLQSDNQLDRLNRHNLKLFPLDLGPSLESSNNDGHLDGSNDDVTEVLAYKANSDKSSILALVKSTHDLNVSYKTLLYSFQDIADTHNKLQSFLEPKAIIPLSGHLDFTNFIWTFDGNYLFSRRKDTRLFRLFLTDLGLGVKGPLKSLYPGRLVAFRYLQSLEKGSFTILVIQYLPLPDSIYFEVVFSIFVYKKHTWVKDELKRFKLSGITDEVIESEQLDSLYFLTNPAVATTLDLSRIALVFLRQIFFFEFSQPNHASKGIESLPLHGYQLSWFPCPELSGPDFDIGTLHLIPHKDKLIMVALSEV